MEKQESTLPEASSGGVPASYIDRRVGITRASLNVRAFIGIFVFGWLMKMNYDDLGEKGIGWTFLIAMGFAFAIGQQTEPMFFAFGLAIYLASWVHTNVLLTTKQSIARDQFLKAQSHARAELPKLIDHE